MDFTAFRFQLQKINEHIQPDFQSVTKTCGLSVDIGLI